MNRTIMRLDEKFFNRHTVTVARELLGKYLVRKIGSRTIAAKIVETEAYHGPYDRASHASRGKTERTKIMFGPPGSVYVYMIYGMYYCLNFVSGREGFPAAVLIRAVALPRGRGPGKLCRELKIDRTLNGADVYNWKLWVEDRGEKVNPRFIRKGKRIGVDYAGPWRHKLWRFTLLDRQG